MRDLKFGLSCTYNYVLQRLDKKLGTNFNKPFSFFLNLTYRCNLHCKHCWLKREKTSSLELSTKHWKKIIFDIHSKFKYSYLCFSGGEPFLREDIFELIEFAKSLNFFVFVNTNACLKKNILNKIIKSDVDVLKISVDGIGKSHDYIRGEGMFNFVKKSINYLIKNDKKVGITMVINEKNIDTPIEDILIFLRENKISSIEFLALLLDYNIAKRYSYFNLWPKDIKKINQFLDEIIKAKKRNENIVNPIGHFRLMKKYYANPYTAKKINCLHNKLKILADGSVILCKDIIGNANSSSIYALWYSKKAKDLRKNFKNCKRDCPFFICNYQDSLKNKIFKFKLFKI